MIINQNRIIKSVIYTIILGIIASVIESCIFSGFYMGMSIGVASIVAHVISSLCALTTLIIWWYCFFGPEEGPDIRLGGGSNGNWGGTGAGYHGTPVTTPTETYHSGKTKKEDSSATVNLYNKTIKVYCTYSDGKTVCTLELDPKDIRCRGGYTVGSSRSCDFPINDRTIAAQHARLYAAGQILCIQNLGNNNGIKVNGRELDYEQSAPFPRRGTVYLGGVRLDFRD